MHGPATLQLPTARLHHPSLSPIPSPPFTILSYNVCGVNNHTRHTELRMFLSRMSPSNNSYRWSISHASNEDDIVALARCTHDASLPISCFPAVDVDALPVFLLGDFNARHPRWSEEDASAHNSRGNWVNTHLLSSNIHSHVPLTLLNMYFPNTRRTPTHISTSITHARGGDSVLDLAMTSHPDMVSNMDILTDEFIRSDHMPIMLSLHSPSHRTNTLPPAAHTRWRTRDVSWSLYAEYLKQSLPTWTDTHTQYNTPTSTRLTQHDIDVCWAKLHDIIMESAHACGTSIITPQSQHWWCRDPAIPRLHAEYRSACNHFRRLLGRHNHRSRPSADVLQAARINCKLAKHAFNKAAAAARRGADDDLAASIDESSASGARPKLLHSQWKRNNPSKRTPLASFPDAIGDPPATPQVALNNMAAHLASVSSTLGQAATTQYAKQQELVVAAYLNSIDNAASLSAPLPFVMW